MQYGNISNGIIYMLEFDLEPQSYLGSKCSKSAENSIENGLVCTITFEGLSPNLDIIKYMYIMT